MASSSSKTSSAVQSMQFQVQPVTSERFGYTMHFFKNPAPWHTLPHQMIMATFAQDSVFKLKINQLAQRDTHILNNILKAALHEISAPGCKTKQFIRDFHDTTPQLDLKTAGQDLYIKFGANAKVFNATNSIVEGPIPTGEFLGKSLVKILGVTYNNQTKLFALMCRMVQVKILEQEEITVCLLTDDDDDDEINELASKALDAIDGPGPKRATDGPKRAHGEDGPKKPTGSKKNKLA